MELHSSPNITPNWYSMHEVNKLLTMLLVYNLLREASTNEYFNFGCHHHLHLIMTNVFPAPVRTFQLSITNYLLSLTLNIRSRCIIALYGNYYKKSQYILLVWLEKNSRLVFQSGSDLLKTLKKNFLRHKISNCESDYFYYLGPAL